MDNYPEHQAWLQNNDERVRERGVCTEGTRWHEWDKWARNHKTQVSVMTLINSENQAEGRETHKPNTVLCIIARDCVLTRVASMPLH